ncbi:MAG: hypothetical protein NC414_11635, partial [Bacteroidales bacterium]|nr:hypothetical protein [Bacteroidales bacterium]
VFQILLSGKQIIALEDKSADRADIRINGGYGYNYAIIPLLEAFGVAPLTQAQYDARVRADGSSLKYILDVLFNEIDEILKSPVEQILSRVANIFYFIGSDGINTIAANLLAPVNKLLESVDKLYPIAINIDLSAKEIVKTYIGVEHKNVNAGVNINVSGKALAEFINGFIGNININGTVINLHLDLDWNALAAKMAKTNADGSIAYIGTAQNYGYGTCEAGAALKNISGDAADALVTILDAVLTKNNCKNIKDLVDSLLAGTTLPEEVKNIINDILSDPNAIKNLVAAVILILTGGYSVTNLNFIFKYLGNIVYNVQDVDKAVTSLDKVLLAAVPVIIDLLADTSKPEAEQSFIDKLAAGLEKEGKQATIENIVDYLLGSMVFTNDMMATITSAIVNALGGFLTADLANTLNSLIGINLAPVAFANKTGNAQFKAYVNVTPADATVGVTWADVLKAHQKTVGDKVVIAPIFTNASSKDGFISDVLDMLKPLEDILAFLLTGKDLSLTVDGTNLMTLAAGNAYNKALLPLILKGLGLKELGAVEKTANTANAAIANVVEYVFNLVDALEAAPFSTILTVVSNLSFFIANNDVSVAINNLVAPILGIVDALDGVISRDQIDGLLKNFIKIGSTSLGLTDIIHIADNEGENLIKIINELLGNIEVKDDKGETVYVLNALPVDFFVNLAKAAIKIDQPTGNLKVGTDVTEWHTEKGDAIMYVLSTVLNKDFLEILCTLLNLDPTSDIGQIIISLAGREQDLIGVILKLLNKYLVEYKAFNVPELNKITVEYLSDKTHQQLNDALAGIDSLIPTVLALVGQDAQNLGDIVYPLFVKDDIANLLVSTIAKLLAGLPSDTIDQVMGYVNDLTNLKNLDIAPKAFANVKFGSKLGAYIGNAKTWADVWNAHSVETVDEEGNATRTATSYDWGIKTTADLVNLVCDMLLPLDDILALLLMGGTERAAFEADGTHNGSKITAFDEINVIGGDGYNYSIIPLLELLGVKNVKTQAEYEAFVKANHGSTLKYILDAVFGRVDEILNAPIASVLDILANLAYAIGNDNVETIVANLLAPVNNLIEAVDRLFPISISINLGNIGTSESIIETYLGKQHPGVPAGIAIALKGSDINSLLANVLGGIMINGNPLGLNLDLNWIQIAQTAAAEGNNKKIKMNSSKLDTKYDIYNGSAYKNVVGDRADSFVALIKAILTKDNLDAILKALGQENGFGDPIDSIIDAIIENPEKIIDVLLALLGNGKVSYVPIQNRLIKTQRFDYSTYFLLTETNADIIAENLDSIITRILSQAGMGSLKQFVGTNYITGDTLNMLLDKIVPLLGGDTVNNILVALADFAKQNNVSTDLDLTVASFYKKFINNKDYKNPTNVNIRAAANVLKAAVDKNGTWADVGSFEGVNWGFAPGDIHGFARAFADVLKPLNSILELLLMGEGKELNILDILKLGGGNGYDYAIIPILEAFGLEANEVLNFNEYKKLVEKDDSELLGYILEKIADFADELLDKPVDTLLTILPNVAYFISNEGVYLAVRNLVAPLFAIVDVFTSAYGIDLASMLNVSKLLHNINIGIQVLGAKYDFKIPEIDFLKLAQQGGTSTKEVATSRSYAASSYEKPTDPFVVRENTPNKRTQTFVVSDKGDTLTLVLTWALEMFGDQHNRDALVNWLAGVFKIDGGAKQIVAYGINKMFDTCTKYEVPDIIVASLFEIFGIGITVDMTFRKDVANLNKIWEDIFGALASNEYCIYCSIAEVMENLTGVWNDTIGSSEDYHGAVQEAEKTLNWFQRFFLKIKQFFQKIFGIFK